MSARPAVVLAVLLVLLAPAFLATVGVLSPGARAQSTTPLSASMSGPTVVSTGTTTRYLMFGWGGPAIASNGTLVGNITYYTTLVASNLTGVSLSPPSAHFPVNQSDATDLSVGNASETLTIDVMVSSVHSGTNESTNFSYVVHIVHPYVVSATIVNSSTVEVTSFNVYVLLDGAVIGNVTVPNIQPGGKYALTFAYPTLGLSPGDHTFTIALDQQNGLVTFANGETVYTVTVYVTGPAPNYTLWYVAGIVAFFGAIFIFVSRVAARRRGAARR